MIDVKKIVDDIGGESNPPPETEPDGDESGGEDHKARIQAAMAKVQDGLAELQKCIDEY